MKYLLTLLILLSFSAFPQISISNSDINVQYTVGNTTTIHTDTIVTSVDIGQMGSTSWDFSFLTPNPSYDLNMMVVDPSSSPFIGNFPSANICAKATANFGGVISDSYSYLSVNGSFDFYGNASESEYMPGQMLVATTTYDPTEITATFPYTYNSTANYNGELTIVQTLNGTPISTITETRISNKTVDAYGSMILPGGRVVDALREREDVITIVQGTFPIYSRYISYSFIAEDGSNVNVPSDTTQPTTGIISNSAPVSWSDALVTSIKIDKTIPSEYTLKQNYPNPFNPSTKIEYSIPAESFVQLKVYDLLGNNVATLVDKEQVPGTYKADFSGSGLASGLYIAQLKVGNYVKNIKMTLLK